MPNRWWISISTLFAQVFVTVLLNAQIIDPQQTVEQQWDIVIRGGTVIDGTGQPRFTADVAIRGDRIVAVSAVPLDIQLAR